MHRRRQRAYSRRGRGVCLRDRDLRTGARSLEPGRPGPESSCLMGQAPAGESCFAEFCHVRTDLALALADPSSVRSSLDPARVTDDRSTSTRPGSIRIESAPGHPSPESEQRSRAHRLTDRLAGSPLGVVVKSVLLVAAVVGALVVIADAGLGVRDRWQREFNWREPAYRKLTSLHAGFSIRRFEQVLGTPVFERVKGKFREQTFRGRDYWVQAVSNAQGSVFLYSVTSCDPEFRPTFKVTGLPRPVTLQKSTYSQATTDTQSLHNIDFFASGGPGGSRFFETVAATNPSNYKSLGFGVSEACPGWFHEYLSPSFRALLPPIRRASYLGPLKGAPAWVVTFRRQRRVNTYAESAPNVRLEPSVTAFQLGPNRLLTQTVEHD